MVTRRAFFSIPTRTGLGAIGFAGYGFGVEPGLTLRVQTNRIAPPNWPDDFKLRIAVIADIHAGAPHMAEWRIEHIVNTVNNQGPDIILLLGDYRATHHFVTESVSYERVAQAFRRLEAPLGVHAILGNHDWWDDKEAQQRRAGPIAAQRALENEAIPVYQNSGIRLLKDGRPFWLLGLGDSIAFFNQGGGFTGLDDLAATLKVVTDDAPVILMIHEPDSFVEVPDRVSLTLAGHTHGGQCRVLGWSPIVPSAFGNRFAYGHIVEEGRHMIVSGGLGCSNIPVRFGMPPEINIIELGEGVVNT